MERTINANQFAKLHITKIRDYKQRKPKTKLRKQNLRNPKRKRKIQGVKNLPNK